MAPLGKAPKGMTSLQNRDDLMSSSWRDARCPYCKKFVFHAGWNEYESRVRVVLGSTHQVEGLEKNPYPQTLGFGSDLVPPGPKWRQLPDGRRAFQCACDAGWILDEDEIERWYKEAVEAGRKFFLLPTRATRPL